MITTIPQDAIESSYGPPAAQASPWTLSEGTFYAEASSLGLKPGQGYPVPHPTKAIKFGLGQLRSMGQDDGAVGDTIGWTGTIAGAKVVVWND